MLSDLASIEVEIESSSDLRPLSNLPISGLKNRNPKKNVDLKTSKHTKSKGYKCLDLLIQRYENWLPILIIQHGLYLHFDSSRIEGLYGLLKGDYCLNIGNNLCGVLKTYILIIHHDGLL